MQIKLNRQDRVQTAYNRVESRKHQIVRARCADAKASNGIGCKGVGCKGIGCKGIGCKGIGCALSQPGPSGPQKKIAWVADDAGGPSERAKREGEKKMAREAILAVAARKRAQKTRQAAIEAEKLRNLQIADEMMMEE